MVNPVCPLTTGADIDAGIRHFLAHDYDTLVTVKEEALHAFVNHQPVNIKLLVNQSLASLIIPQRIKISINDLTTNSDALLDSEQMMQVLTNLIKNAFDAMPAGGQIDIKLEDTLSDIIITISDTGTGIREEDRSKIFEPFFTTKSIGQGTGLGLATTYGIVKMHKGQITVESNNNPAKGPTGTSFRIVLPRRKA